MPSQQLYRLRNGIVVELNTEDATWGTGDVKVISVPEDYNPQNDPNLWLVGEHNCILVIDKADPLPWSGGAHGPDYDIVEAVIDNA